MKFGFTALTALALLGATAAHAQTIDQAQALEVIVQNNAREEAAVAHDIAMGGIRGRGVALAEAQLARLYRMQAIAFDNGAAPADLKRVVDEQQQGLLVPLAPMARRSIAAERLARQHEALAAARSAEQQQAIARQWAAGALSVEQVAALEAGQSALAEARLALTRTGADSVDLAMRLQHLQNIQDWAIATAQPAL